LVETAKVTGGLHFFQAADNQSMLDGEVVNPKTRNSTNR